MKRITTYIVLLPVLLLSIAAGAQNDRKLTLAEAIKLGLEQSKQLKLAEGRTAAENARLAQYKAQQIPLVGLYANYTRLSNNIAPFSATLGDFSLTIPQIINQGSVIGSINETVFQGLKVHNGIKSEQYLKKAAELDYDKDRSDIIFNIVSAYYNLYKVRESLKLVDDQIAQVSERVKETQKMLDNGVATRNDLVRNQLQLSNFNLSKIDVSNNIQVANYNMTIMLGLPAESDITPDSADIGTAKEVLPLNNYLESALGNRPDLKAGDYRKLSSLSNVKGSKSGYFPSISVGFDYNYMDPTQRLFPPADKFMGAWDAGITLHYNFTGIYTAHHQVNESKALLQQTESQNGILSDNVKMEINQSYVTYKVALDRIKLSAESVEQAETNAADMKSKFRNGTALTTDLLDADVLLLQAKLNLLNSKADAEVAWQQLLKATGTNLK